MIEIRWLPLTNIMSEPFDQIDFECSEMLHDAHAVNLPSHFPHLCRIATTAYQLTCTSPSCARIQLYFACMCIAHAECELTIHILDEYVFTGTTGLM